MNMKSRHITHLQCLSLRGLANVLQQDKPPPFSPERDLVLRSVNVFAGPNGCGKTTVLDAIRSVFEPELLARLRRENLPTNSVSGLSLKFGDGTCIKALFHQTGTVKDGVRTAEWNWQRTVLAVQGPGVTAVKGAPMIIESNLPVVGPVDEQYLQPLSNMLSKLGRVGASWPKKTDLLPQLKDYLSILPRFQHLFPKNKRLESAKNPKFLAEPGKLLEMDGELHQFHGDDLAQSSRVSADYLPSGWKQVVDLLSWIENCEENSVCVIDEPEQHLHPLLQRVLIEQLALISSHKNLQLIIATHSPSFLNCVVWGQDVAVFHLTGGNICPEPDITHILDQLGCVASDLCQSNGIIWVEGPSDRIYINAFLRAWRTQRSPSKKPVFENIHFSYAFFDGSCLTHFSGVTVKNTSSLGCNDFVISDAGQSRVEQELICLLRLNRNGVICIDRDNDFAVDDFGTLIASSAQGRTKLRVANELTKSGFGPIHITDGYTMECYVVEVMPKGFLQESMGRVSIIGSKVQHALRFSALPDDVIATCFDLHPGLCYFVSKLNSAIDRWNG
jgi:ABC-type lipoprotein export system ATPase subunit